MYKRQVDEYQDTNACQYALLKLLAGPRAAFTAVGDDDQAIYGWRGADIENLRGLPRDYPNLKLIKLEQNYRSTVRILKAANALISHNEKPVSYTHLDVYKRQNHGSHPKGRQR